MEPTPTFLSNIRNLLAQDRTDRAIALLQDLLQDSPKLDTAILQSARLSELMSAVRLGLVDLRLASEQKNQIRAAVLDLLREIEASGATAEIQDQIEARDMEGGFRRIAEKIKTNRGAGTSEILKGKTIEDLDASEVLRFFQQSRTYRHFLESRLDMEQLSTQQKLRQLSLADNGHLYKGTFLCLGESHQIGALSHSFMESRFVMFRGKTRSGLFLVESVSGNVLQQYEKMLFLLMKHMPLRRDVEESKDSYEIPLLAFKELLTNAYVHRSYDPDILHTIQVEIFDDRLEIKSPGQFPGNLTLENSDISVLVNPTIAAIFYLSGHIEKSGTGISRAKEALAQAGLPMPVLAQYEDPRYVKVTIFRKN